MMKKAIACALERLGRRALPQHRHLLKAIISIWLAIRSKSDPTPKPVAMSES